MAYLRTQLEVLVLALLAVASASAAPQLPHPQGPLFPLFAPILRDSPPPLPTDETAIAKAFAAASDPRSAPEGHEAYSLLGGDQPRPLAAHVWSVVVLDAGGHAARVHHAADGLNEVLRAGDLKCTSLIDCLSSKDAIIS